MDCKNCGHKNAANARFCAKCGTPLTPAVPPPAAKAGRVDASMAAMKTPPVTPAPPQAPAAPPPPIRTPATPPPVPPGLLKEEPPHGFIGQLTAKSGLLGIILLALFFFPWGRLVFTQGINVNTAYSKQFIYLNIANAQLGQIISGGEVILSNLLPYLLLFIPLTAFSLFLWMTHRKVYPLLTLVFSLLGAGGIFYTILMTYGSEFIRFEFLSIFEDLCLLYLLFLAVVSGMKLAAENKPKATLPSDGLMNTAEVLGYVLGIIFFLPLQFFFYPTQSIALSILNLGYSPFTAWLTIRTNFLLLQMGRSVQTLGQPLGLQVIMLLLALLMVSTFVAAALAVASRLNKRRAFSLLLVFSILGLAGLILRMNIAPMIITTIQIGRMLPLRALIPTGLSIFYILQILIQVFLIVYSGTMLGRKKV